VRYYLPEIRSNVNSLAASLFDKIFSMVEVTEYVGITPCPLLNPFLIKYFTVEISARIFVFGKTRSIGSPLMIFLFPAASSQIKIPRLVNSK
jgi:hypothetical protein